mgnify:FL=1
MDKHDIYAAVLSLGYARDDMMAFYHTTDKERLELALSQFRKAARALGFTLTPITEAPHVAPPSTVDPNSGRPSLVEPAALSELSHNFGG